MDIKDVGWWRDKPFENLDWVEVVDIDMGGGYDWSEFHAWYSPSTRQYYWGSGSGCSCDSFGDDFNKVGDFSNGPDRASVMKAITDWGTAYDRMTATQLVDATRKVNAFDPRDHQPKFNASTEILLIKEIEA